MAAPVGLWALLGRHAQGRGSRAPPSGRPRIARRVPASAPGPGSAGGGRTAEAAPKGGACGYLHTRLAVRATQTPALACPEGGAEEAPLRHRALICMKTRDWLAAQRSPHPDSETGRARCSGSWTSRRPRWLGATPAPGAAAHGHGPVESSAPHARGPPVVPLGITCPRAAGPFVVLLTRMQQCRNCGRERSAKWAGRGGAGRSAAGGACREGSTPGFESALCLGCCLPSFY